MAKKRKGKKKTDAEKAVDKLEENSKPAEGEEEERKRRDFVFHYSPLNDIYGANKWFTESGEDATNFDLAESVLIANKACFVKIKKYYNDTAAASEDNNNIIIESVDSIELRKHILKPSDDVATTSLTMNPFSFASLDELKTYVQHAKKVKIGYLFNLVKKFVRMCVDTSEYNLNLIAASIILSYFVDRLSNIFYIYLVGKPASGKGTILTIFKLLAYRSALMSSTNGAAIYNKIGTVEPAQCVILLDEVNDMDDQQMLLDILKTGYRRDGVVEKVLDASTSKRSQPAYFTYCLKVLASEHELKEWKTEGLLTRTFVVRCNRGHPKYKATRIDFCGGDKKYEEIRKQFDDLHRLLFAYRLVNYSKATPDIRFNPDVLEGREAEISIPLIGLFQRDDSSLSSDESKEVLSTLSHFVNRQRGAKSTSLEKAIYDVLHEFIYPPPLKPRQELLISHKFKKSDDWEQLRSEEKVRRMADFLAVNYAGWGSLSENSKAAKITSLESDLKRLSNNDALNGNGNDGHSEDEEDNNDKVIWEGNIFKVKTASIINKLVRQQEGERGTGRQGHRVNLPMFGSIGVRTITEILQRDFQAESVRIGEGGDRGYKLDKDRVEEIARAFIKEVNLDGAIIRRDQQNKVTEEETDYINDFNVEDGGRK